MAEQALSDVRVLDLTSHIAGPYCTKLLADYGADVIKVERPGTGDVARCLGPFPNDEPHPEKSGLFIHLNTNKRSITLNIETATGKKILKELVKNTDILVETFAPGYLPGLGLGYNDLSQINPKLVMASITPFGQTGPYKNYKATDLVMYGMGPLLYSTGLPEREPVKMGGTVTTSVGGNVAAPFILGAYLGARLQGKGQYLDISLQEIQCAQTERASSQIAGFAYSGAITPRQPGGLKVLGIPNDIYPCKDGYVLFMTMPLWWPRVAQMLDRPDLITDPRFADFATRLANEDQFNAILYPWLMEHTKAEIVEKASKAKEAAMGVNTPEDVFKNIQFAARDYWADVEHPVAGIIKQTGAVFKMQRGGFKVRRPAPLLGQHNIEVYCEELGYSREELVSLRELGVI